MDYTSLPRRKLQQMAKSAGIRANDSSANIIAALRANITAEKSSASPKVAANASPKMAVKASPKASPKVKAVIAKASPKVAVKAKKLPKKKKMKRVPVR